MPRRPRKNRKFNTSKMLTAIELQQLLRGYAFFEPELSEAELKRLWNKHKDFMMSLIGQNVLKFVPGFFISGIPIPFGSRPWCWWEWSAPEPRRLISGDPTGAMPEKGLHFGVPRFYKSVMAHNSLIYESEFQYLKRLNLLLPGEEKLHKIKSKRSEK